MAEELEQPVPPGRVQWTGPAALGLAARRVAEPPDVAGRAGHVAEEAPPSEAEAHDARRLPQVEPSGVSADVEQTGVPGRWCGGVDHGPGPRSQAVGADEQVGVGGRPVGERGTHAATGRGVDRGQTSSVGDRDTAADRLVAQDPIQIGPPDRLHLQSVRARDSPTGRSRGPCPQETAAPSAAWRSRPPRRRRRRRGWRGHPCRCWRGSARRRRRRRPSGWRPFSAESMPARPSARAVAVPASPAPAIRAVTITPPS